MSQRFFITGLPRSRTAWMAAFFSLGKTMCYHEPICDIDSLDGLKHLYDSPFYDHVGVSDSGLGFHIGWILENLGPKTLIIGRPRRDVDLSLKRIGLGESNQTALLERELDTWCSHPLVKYIPYALLGNRRVMERAWFHLMPGVPFDEVRFDQFSRLNVQADLDQVKQRVSDRAPFINGILGDVFAQVVHRPS